MSLGDPALADAIFAFEEAAPELPLLPIAARRALDHAGLKVSLEGWTSLSFAARRELVLAGAADRVDVTRVNHLAIQAQPPPTAIEPRGDPDPLEPPEAIGAH